MKISKLLPVVAVGSTATLLAAAVPGGDPRPTDVDLVSSQTLGDLQTCIFRRLPKGADITMLPLADGVSIEFEFTIDYQIRDIGTARRITVAYRHPATLERAKHIFAKMAEKCFPAATWVSGN